VAVILDTNAISALLTGSEALGDLLDQAEHHHLPVVVIGEYRYGLLRSQYRKHLELLLDTLIDESIVLAIDQATAAAYALVRDELRRAGRPIPENDVWIAALARQQGEPVVSQDQHFDHVPGLTRLSW
jgi:predicted nucleic acid-binding protein